MGGVVLLGDGGVRDGDSVSELVNFSDGAWVWVLCKTWDFLGNLVKLGKTWLEWG